MKQSGYLYVKYNDEIYTITFDLTKAVGESVEQGLPGNTGRKVKYDSNGDGTAEEWIVLTDIGGTLEIVSTDVLYDASGNGLTLGSEDDVNIARDSYKNAQTIIETFCDEIVTADDNVEIRAVTLDVYNMMELLGISGASENYWISDTEETPVGGSEVIFDHNVYCWDFVTNSRMSVGLYRTSLGGGHDGQGTQYVILNSETFGVRPIVVNPVNIEYVD